MAVAKTTAGTKLYISAAVPGTVSLANLKAISSWSEVGEVTSIGDYGKSYNKVTHVPLADRKTRKYKGSYDEGALSLELAGVPDDSGQIIIVTALTDDADYAFRVVYQDGESDYFTGQVFSYVKGAGGADNIVKRSCTIEINSEVFNSPGDSTYRVTFTLAGNAAQLVGPGEQWIESGMNSLYVHAVIAGTDEIAWVPTPPAGADAVTIRAENVTADLHYVGTVSTSA